MRLPVGGTVPPGVAVLRLEVEPTGSGNRLALFGDDGARIVEWVQEDAHGPEVRRSPDGAVATIAAGAIITAVRVNDGHILARCATGRGIEGTVPLDGRWTLELTGELALDGGHTGFHQSWTLFVRWPGEDPGEHEAEVARLRTELAAAASVGIHRRFALRCADHEVVVHESDVAAVDGGEMLLWPPIVGPAGVLLRHAIETDDGSESLSEPQRPWLVRPDGSVTRLPFELGVSPLIALPDGRWLMPGADTVWRDDYDEPLSLLAEDGALEPLLVGGRPVAASRVLREAAPELLSALAPVAPGGDVPWGTVDARLDTASDELHMAIEIDGEDRPAVVVAALPLDGAAPARLVAHVEPTSRCEVAVAP